VKQVLDEIIEKLPEEFNMMEIMGKVEERTPYVIVAFQECERMNFLTTEIKRSLRELDLGLKGELTITSDMEDLENALFFDQVPPVWASRAYPSLLGLTGWFVDLLLRIRELETWSTDFVVCAYKKYITTTRSYDRVNATINSLPVTGIGVARRVFQSSITTHRHHAIDS